MSKDKKRKRSTELFEEFTASVKDNKHLVNIWKGSIDLEGVEAVGLLELQSPQNEEGDKIRSVLKSVKAWLVELDALDLPQVMTDSERREYANKIFKATVDGSLFKKDCKVDFVKRATYCPLQTAFLLSLASAKHRYPDKLPVSTNDDGDDDGESREIIAIQMTDPPAKSLHPGFAKNYLYIRRSQIALLREMVKQPVSFVLIGSPGIGKSQLEIIFLSLLIRESLSGDGFKLLGISLPESFKVPKVVLRQVGRAYYAYFLKECVAFQIHDQADFTHWFAVGTSWYFFEPMNVHELTPHMIARMRSVVAVSVYDRRIHNYLLKQPAIPLYLDHLTLPELQAIAKHIRANDPRVRDSAEELTFMSEENVAVRCERHGGVFRYVLGTPRSTYSTVRNLHDQAVQSATGWFDTLFPTGPDTEPDGMLGHHVIKHVPITYGDEKYRRSQVQFVSESVRRELYDAARRYAKRKTFSDTVKDLKNPFPPTRVQSAALNNQFKLYISMCLQRGVEWKVHALQKADKMHEHESQAWQDVNYKMYATEVDEKTAMLAAAAVKADAADRGPQPVAPVPAFAADAQAAVVEVLPVLEGKCRYEMNEDASVKFADMKEGVVHYFYNPGHSVADMTVKRGPIDLHIYKVSREHDVSKVHLSEWEAFVGTSLGLDVDDPGVRFHYHYVPLPNKCAARSAEVFLDGHIRGLVSVDVVAVPVDYTTGVPADLLHPPVRK